MPFIFILHWIRLRFYSHSPLFDRCNATHTSTHTRTHKHTHAHTSQHILGSVYTRASRIADSRAPFKSRLYTPVCAYPPSLWCRSAPFVNVSVVSQTFLCQLQDCNHVAVVWIDLANCCSPWLIWVCVGTFVCVYVYVYVCVCVCVSGRGGPGGKYQQSK